MIITKILSTKACNKDGKHMRGAGYVEIIAEDHEGKIVTMMLSASQAKTLSRIMGKAVEVFKADPKKVEHDAGAIEVESIASANRN